MGCVTSKGIGIERGWEKEFHREHGGKAQRPQRKEKGVVLQVCQSGAFWPWENILRFAVQSEKLRYNAGLVKVKKALQPVEVNILNA